jgi:hypothetical protein
LRLKSRFAIVVVLALIAPLPCLAQDWSYFFYQTEISVSMDTLRIAVWESPGGLRNRTAELVAATKSGPSRKGAPPSGPMGGNWTMIDLSGSPSAGDPTAILALLDDLATDPMTDAFAAPVFFLGDTTIIMKPEIHIRFEASVPLAVIEAELAAAGVGPILRSDWITPNLFVVDGGSRASTEVLAAANLLALRPGVIFAHPDMILTGEKMVDVRVEYPPEIASRRTPTAVSTARMAPPAPSCGPLENIPPNDPFLFESWGIEGFNDIDVDGFGAWAVCTGDPLLLVAVLDDGVQRDHPDMDGIQDGADFTVDCMDAPCLNEPEPTCCRGEPRTDHDRHGISVAGIIAATADNGLGSAGIAPEVRILPVRAGTYWVFGSTYIPRMDLSWLVNGIGFAVDAGAKLTNLSWNFSTPMAVVETAYKAAHEAGVVNFNSAGNGNEAMVLRPGRFAEVHSISGINFFGELFFVNENFGSNWGSDVFLTAPGQYDFTLDRTGDLGYEDATGSYGADYSSLTGTSFACPFVSGVAALCWSMNPGLGSEELLLALRLSATDLGPPGRDDFFGYGLVNAAACIAIAPMIIAANNFDDGDFSQWDVVVGN